MRKNQTKFSGVISRIRQFAEDRAGSTAMEYAIIAALISVAIIAGVTSIGNSTSANFDNVNTTLEGE